MDQWGKLKDGQTNTFKPCNITQSPEKFLCLHSECRQGEKKFLQCYECLSKQHMGKNKVIRHHDDFIELDKFMQQIQAKVCKKEQLLNTIILNCNDFQKEKLQHIELAYKAEIAIPAKIQIEKEIDQFISTLGEELMKLKTYQIYQQSKHLQLVQCYYENEQGYNDNIKQSYKKLVEKVQILVQSLDCDIKSQLKRLEEKTKNIQSQLNSSTKFLPNIPFIVYIILPFFLSFLINYYYFDQQIGKLQQQYNILNSSFQEFQIYKTFPNQIQEIKTDLGVANDQISQITTLMSQQNQLIVECQENLDKLKLRFDSYKKSSQSQIQEIKTELLKENKYDLDDTNKEIKDLSQKLNNFIEQVNNTELITDVSKLKQTLNDEISKNTQIRTYFSQTIRKQQIIEKNSDLVAKIHVGLSTERLADFTLIYDAFLAKYLSLSTMEKLKNLATKDNQDALICVGGLETKNLGKLLVVGCDFASEVFESTDSERKARKSQNGDIYWYRVDDGAFGFAPNENIKLTVCDDEDPDDERRFSVWHGIRLRDGGRRIGKEGYLISSEEYKMQIYMLR